jgi:RHS repeat-associated protein
MERERFYSRRDQLGTRYFIHAGQQIMAEYGSTGSLQAKYVYGTGIDEPLEMERSGQKYYYSRDGLGSVAALTNASGQVVESYTYDVYGKPNAASSVGNPYLFTGRQYDAASGVYYYRARWYAPAVGKFLQRDPIGLGGGINVYAMTLNDPVNHLDPLGLQEIDPSGFYDSGTELNMCSVTPPEQQHANECIKGFLVCMGNTIVAPGWTTLVAGAGDVAGFASTAEGWSYAAGRNLSTPRNSYIFRDMWKAGGRLGPLMLTTTVVIAEANCISEEVACMGGWH